jgi:hypothetical protein
MDEQAVSNKDSSMAPTGMDTPHDHAFPIIDPAMSKRFQEASAKADTPNDACDAEFVFVDLELHGKPKDTAAVNEETDILPTISVQTAPALLSTRDLFEKKQVAQHYAKVPVHEERLRRHLSDKQVKRAAHELLLQRRQSDKQAKRAAKAAAHAILLQRHQSDKQVKRAAHEILLQSRQSEQQAKLAAKAAANELLQRQHPEEQVVLAAQMAANVFRYCRLSQQEVNQAAAIAADLAIQAP